MFVLDEGNWPSSMLVSRMTNLPKCATRLCVSTAKFFRAAGETFTFVEEGKPESPENNPRSKGENQQQTQPTYETGPESNPGHIGGRRAVSTLHHPCALTTAISHDGSKSQ